MRSARRWLVGASAVAAAGLMALAACTGDDEAFAPAPVYAYDAATFDRVTPSGFSTDGAAPNLDCGDAGDAPPRLLVVHRARPELAAVNLATRAVDGRYLPDGGGLLLTSASANQDPWLLDQEHDLVTRLDAREPWKPRASWDVHGDDGEGASAPSAVIQVSCTKAYVLRAHRDRVAVIDPSQAGAGNVLTPTAFVGLGAHGLVGAVWVPAKRKVFVLAANADRTRRACTDRAPSISAVDVATDGVVSLAGDGAGGAIELAGYAPVALRYDPAFDRLVTLSAGCDAGRGIERRFVEQVDLATGAVKTLLDLSNEPAPTGLALLDGDHALLTFDARGVYWDPHETTLGPDLAGGLELAALDGRGGFAGARRSADGGLELVSIPVEADAGANEGARVLVTDPFSNPGGNAASLEPWPHR